MAKSIKLSRPHGTTADAALEKLRALGNEIATRYSINVQFIGRKAVVSGRGVKGEVSVDDANLALDLSLGLPASLVAAKIESRIHTAVAEHFGAAST